MGERVPRRLSALPDAPSGVGAGLSGLGALLAETPTSVALATLAADQDRQPWAEQGMRLHEDLEYCHSCGNRLTAERRQRLAKHFDQSWFDIRGRAQAILQRVQSQKTSLGRWLEAIPAAEGLARVGSP